VATQILRHPESKPNDIAINQFATSLTESDGGRSLTIEQMAELAKRLAYYTSQAYPEVGGTNQIALLRKPGSMKIEQPTFPEPSRPPVSFSLMVNSRVRGRNTVNFDPGFTLVAVRCSWDNVQRELDGNYYIGNDFTNSSLTYDGGSINLDDTNRVINSALVIGPHGILESDAVRRLTATFSWSQVGYAAASKE
jgi:hypothetical protein